MYKNIYLPFNHVYYIISICRTTSTAGGCGNYKDSFLTNPKYLIKVKRTTTSIKGKLLCKLETKEAYSVGITLFPIRQHQLDALSNSNSNGNGNSILQQLWRGSSSISSGDFRKCFCCLEAEIAASKEGFYLSISTTLILL